MNKNKQLVLKENVSPKTKKRIFRELLSLYIEKSIDGDLDYETILWRIRECSNGLMFQFSDGTINTLILKQNDAIWKENEKRSIILKDKPNIKRQLKKRIMRCYYELKPKGHETMTNIKPESSTFQTLFVLNKYMTNKNESNQLELKTWMSIIESNLSEMIIFEPFILTDFSVQHINNILQTQIELEEKYIHNLNSIAQNKRMQSYDEFKYFVEAILSIYKQIG